MQEYATALSRCNVVECGFPGVASPSSRPVNIKLDELTRRFHEARQGAGYLADNVYAKATTFLPEGS
jgi:hypothetical protein